MADIIPGTSRLMVVEVGTPRSPPSYNLPVPFVQNDGHRNHLLVVAGAEPNAGRSGYVNFLCSTLTIMGRPFALIEVATAQGSATRAHKAEGAIAELISPMDSGWHTKMIDRIHAHSGRTVVLSVAADMWLPFASIERPLLQSVGDSRPVGYLFVDHAGRGARAQAHRTWLLQNGLPDFEQRVVARGAPLYPPSPPVTPDHAYTVVPYFEPQVADAVFGRANPSGPSRSYATFHAAWAQATTGTQAVMYDPVKDAMRDIAELIGMTGRKLGREKQ